MVDHQNQPLAPGDFDQFLTFSGRSRHRFFDERVLARQQARPSQRVMALYRSGDDDGVDIGRLDHSFWSSDRLQVRIQCTRMFQPCNVQIAYNLKPAIRQTGKVSTSKGYRITAYNAAN